MTIEEAAQVHILLDVTTFNDPKERGAFVSTMEKSAPQSPYYVNSPVIQAQVADVVATYNAVTTADATAAASAHQAALDAAAAASARTKSNKSIVLLKASVLHVCTTPEEVALFGYDGYTGKPPPPPMVAPAQIDQKPGRKASGRVTASVHEPKGKHGRYAAEGTASPVTASSVWSTLTGNGKSRKLNGASGTSMCVRFALVRGQLQSDWSQYVTVTFP